MSGCLGTGKSAICGTGVIVDDKFRYFTVCFGMEVISVIFVESKIG
jgi:hypothetical protein